MRLALIFDRHRADTLGGYLERAARHVGHVVDHFWTHEVSSIPPTYALYLRVDHGDDYSTLPAALRPCVFYAVDTHLKASWKKIRRIARGYDLVYCAQRQAAEALPNGAWLPFGCDLEFHGSVGLPLQWDVAFVGTDGGVPRKFYLQALRERYPHHSIGHAPHTMLGAIYSHSRIGFNYAIQHDVNMRIFEVLCSGALLLTNELPHDDLARLGLREGEHLVSYRTPTELMSRIDYYLQHDAERTAIAQRGMAEALRVHTYQHRMEQLLAVAAERLGIVSHQTPRQEAIGCTS